MSIVLFELRQLSWEGSTLSAQEAALLSSFAATFAIQCFCSDLLVISVLNGERRQCLGPDLLVIFVLNGERRQCLGPDLLVISVLNGKRPVLGPKLGQSNTLCPRAAKFHLLSQQCY